MRDLREMIRNGEVPIGPACLASSPVFVEMIGYAGFDYVMIDTEHASCCPTGFELENMVRAAYVADITPLVRVTMDDIGMIKKALNFGAYGIVVPHVRSKDQAEKIAEAARFFPEGRRGIGIPCAAAKYGFWEWGKFWRESNRRTMVIPLIEDPEGIQNLEQIVQVKGIDAIFFGPGDLSMQMGLEGNISAPEIEKQLDKVLAICNPRGIPVMQLVWDVDSTKRAIEKGCKMISYSADLVIFAQAYRAIIDRINKEVRNIRSRT